ncbi:D-aminoacylase [Haloechinothrix salitolerans]|uniref:Amidohydrolase family protein n=1 Tax=Haloechinothrix salitolerans TaxID=926830 RepID=A0ABW2BV54_9PSEU
MTGTETWLRGGTIVDGTGAAPRIGDVAIRGDRISRVTPPGVVPAHPSDEIDCIGLTVTPGFVDIHTHSDLSFVHHPSAPSKVMQGVTTEVVGNCGFSPFPAHPHRREALIGFLRGIGVPRTNIPWSDFAGYADVVDAYRPVMNVAPLAGHGALRIAATGTDDVTVDGDILRTMERLLRECLDQGAFGLSTGLSYVPSQFAGPDEINALARVVRDHDALYATHARATPDPFDSFDEAIGVGKATGVRVQYSHLALNDPRMWGRADDVVAHFQHAADAGIDVRYDVYPYDASASSLTQYLPAWVQAGGEDGIRRQLADRTGFARARDDLAKGLYGTIPWDWERVVVSLAGPDDEALEGRSIAHGAERYGMTPEELCLRLAMRYGNRAQVVLFYRAEADVAAFLAHPLAIVGSDGTAMPVTAPGRPHPRSFGSHARLLHRYVADEGRLTLADAVHKSTLAPAQRIGITDRGVLTEGARADIAVLDATAVRDTATWTDPCQLASGVRDVWVNGEHTIASGTPTGHRAGHVLRRASRP